MEEREEILRRTMRIAQSKSRECMLNVKRKRKRKMARGGLKCTGLRQGLTYVVWVLSARRRTGLKNKLRSSSQKQVARRRLGDGVESHLAKHQDQKDVER